LSHPFKIGRSEPEVVPTTTTKTITSRSFFGKDGEVAYTTPREFLAFGESLRQKEAHDWAKILLCMQQGMRMDGNPSTGVDVAMRPYTYHRFFKSKAVMGFKLISGAGMQQLIADYQDGTIAIGFSLEDLIEEARRD
jgi:hypothetical protein